MVRQVGGGRRKANGEVLGHLAVVNKRWLTSRKYIYVHAHTWRVTVLCIELQDERFA